MAPFSPHSRPSPTVLFPACSASEEGRRGGNMEDVLLMFAGGPGSEVAKLICVRLQRRAPGHQSRTKGDIGEANIPHTPWSGPGNIKVCHFTPDKPPRIKGYPLTACYNSRIGGLRDKKGKCVLHGSPVDRLSVGRSRPIHRPYLAPLRRRDFKRFTGSFARIAGLPCLPGAGRKDRASPPAPGEELWN